MKIYSFTRKANLLKKLFLSLNKVGISFRLTGKKYLHKHYIENNPYRSGQKINLLKANDDSEYSDAHSMYHSTFVALTASREFHDVFLIDPEGNIIYTSAKESDFATNIFAVRRAW